MEEGRNHSPGISATAQRILRRLLTIGENRAELLLVELQEERERFLLAILLALGITVFVLLAGVALTAALALALWNYSPTAAMLVAALVYLVVAGVLCYRLARLRKDWQTLPATLDQLKKDCECLERTLN
jgi:uncharacterized membrane protein YqjE